MKHYPLTDGGSIPALGLGTWKSKPGEVGPVIREAIRIGYRHFDCAAVYGNEAEIGQAFEAAISEGDVTREELFVTSKLWNDSHRASDVRPALEKTLADLRLEYVDLYLMHWPVVLKPGVAFPRSPSDLLALAKVPLVETWQAMARCKDAGLARHLGVSNFSLKKIDGLADRKIAPIAVNQVEMHPYLAQNELVAHCKARGVHVTAYSPLGSRDRPDGLKKADDPDLLGHPTIAKVAKRHGVSTAQVLIAWAVGRETSVIPKSTHSGRLAENFAAASIRIDEEDASKIAALDAGYRIIDGTFWTPKGSPYTVENLWD